MGLTQTPGNRVSTGCTDWIPTGALPCSNRDMNRPNGLALSLDESILYVDDTRNRHVLAYPLNADLGVGEPSVILDMNVEAQGGPDGMKLDAEGNLYVTGPGGLWVATPEGQHLGTIEFPQAAGQPLLRWDRITGRSLLQPARDFTALKSAWPGGRCFRDVLNRSIALQS